MDENEFVTAESGTVALLNKSEIDMQIATAHKYPRSIKRFRDETLAMVTLNESIAQDCIYSIPRDGKSIEGPSARFAEVVASAWGNSRAGARIISDHGDFVTAQGVFHDLERNVAITYEVQRRIVDKRGNRFKPDMIGVTANAACSIALRNAILKGVPKAFWSDMYEQAKKTAIGDVQTLANRRERALSVLQKYGVNHNQVFSFLGIRGVEDITLEHLAQLFGITTALKEGDTTPEHAFAIGVAQQTQADRKTALSTYDQKLFDTELPKWRLIVKSGKKSLDDLIAILTTKARFTDEQLNVLRGLGVEDAPIKSEAPQQQVDAQTGEIFAAAPAHEPTFPPMEPSGNDADPWLAEYDGQQ